MRISVTVNGREYEREVEGSPTLLSFLREDLGLTGTKEGCAAGECGACTVFLNGRTVNSCLVLAAEADGAAVETIEGEAGDGELSAIQAAFARHFAVQCGFCTGGMIMSVRDCCRTTPSRPSRRSRRASRATSAAAPATSRSSRPCSTCPASSPTTREGA